MAFSCTHTFSKSPPIIKFSRSLPFCGSGSHHNSSPLNQTKCGRDSVCSPFTPRHTSRLYFPTSLQFYTVVDKGDSCMSFQNPASKNLSYTILDFPNLYSANKWRYWTWSEQEDIKCLPLNNHLKCLPTGIFALEQGIHALSEAAKIFRFVITTAIASFTLFQAHQ